MHLKRLKIRSYAGFQETDWIELSPGINVVSGRNNSGKSSFLQCVTGQVAENPHKNSGQSSPGEITEQEVQYEFVCSTKEVLDALSEYKSDIFLQAKNSSAEHISMVLSELKSPKTLELNYKVNKAGVFVSERPSLKQSRPGQSAFTVAMNRGELQHLNVLNGGRENLMDLFVKNANRNCIFYLPSERYHVAKTSLGRHSNLARDTSNLAGFLQFLQGNYAAQFEKIETNLCRVIPSVERVTIDTQQDGFEILVWPEGAGGNRNLALTLAECGTGVSQVLSIFSIVATERSSIIAVDEINSFLHPQAVKDLLSILASEYAENQYIISTHSSDVLTHPSVSRIINVSRTGFNSEVEAFGREDLLKLKESMRSLGISMGDVLSAENFLWVEGATEEIVLPNIINDAFGSMPRGLKIASVSSTGDFSSKSRDKRQSIRIYEHVQKRSAPLSSGNAFLLDRETLTDASVEDLFEKTDGKFAVIPRRMLENYVIDADAIVAVLEEDLGEGDQLDVEIVRGKLVEIAGRKDFATRSKFGEDLKSAGWLKEIDGASLLKTAFGELTHHKVEFQKTNHTPRLFSKIEPREVDDLVRVLGERLVFLGYKFDVTSTQPFSYSPHSR